MKALGLCVHFEAGSGVTQYQGWNFNSMTKIGGKYFAAGPGGLFEIGTGGDDAGTAIDAYVQTGDVDGGAINQKRVRNMYLGGQFYGDMQVSVVDDAGNERSYDVTAPDAGNQRSVKVPLGRDGKGRYWRFKVANVDGSDFSLDSMVVNFVILSRRP